MKVFKGIESIIQNTAERKARAAEVRFGKTQHSAEPPRDVFIRGCEEIAAVLEREGYRFARSGPHCTQKSSDLSFRVSFQSSSLNVAGEYVALWIHAVVVSKRLQTWRRGQPRGLGADDYVAGGQIGNLIEPAAWLEWNLADGESEEGVVPSAIESIRGLAFPYFDRFREIPALVERLAHRELPAMDVVRRLEFLLCYGSKKCGEDMLRQFFHARPDLLAEYHRHLIEFRDGGLPKFQMMGYAKDLARATLAYDLTAPEA